MTWCEGGRCQSMTWIRWDLCHLKAGAIRLQFTINPANPGAATLKDRHFPFLPALRDPSS